MDSKDGRSTTQHSPAEGIPCVFLHLHMNKGFVGTNDFFIVHRGWIQPSKSVASDHRSLWHAFKKIAEKNEKSNTRTRENDQRPVLKEDNFSCTFSLNEKRASRVGLPVNLRRDLVFFYDKVSLKNWSEMEEM